MESLGLAWISSMHDLVLSLPIQIGLWTRMFGEFHIVAESSVQK
jgi:hypothetical protein